jgi:hypothetical protein
MEAILGESGHEKGNGAFRPIVLRWRENQSELFGDTGS